MPGIIVNTFRIDCDNLKFDIQQGFGNRVADMRKNSSVLSQNALHRMIYFLNKMLGMKLNTFRVMCVHHYRQHLQER